MLKHNRVYSAYELRRKNECDNEIEYTGPPRAKRGQGPAQICRISGFVKPKIYGKNAAVWSEKRCDLKKKKKVFTEI